MLFTLGIAVLASVLFGSIPVLKYAGAHLSTRIREGGRALSQSRQQHRARNVLVVVQVSLALVLLICSGLMIRTFRALTNVDPGFAQPERVQTFRIYLPSTEVKEDERVVSFEQEIRDKIAAIPGVESVAIGTKIPMDNGGWHDPIFVEGRTDSLELKNGSLIKGRFVGATDTEIKFQVGSSMQSYKITDVASVKFDSEGAASEVQEVREHARDTAVFVTIPAGTRLSVRTIDAIDSTKNHVGDRFQASLEEPLTADGNVVIPKGVDVYGRLEEAKTSGTFTGKSELRLELTGVVVNGQTMPLVTGEYELSGKSRGASTAKRTLGGAAVGSIIGAIAGGGKGAAIGAGVGGAAGAGSEIITKGEQVKVPSETLLDFTLQQSVSIPVQPN